MEQRVTDRDSIRTALFLFLAIFALSFAVYFFTREDSPTPFNNFVRLADAILHGRLYLTSDVSWLEIAPFDGKYYIVPPPLPAFLILPVVAVFGLSTNQTLISIFFGSLNVSLAFLAARALSKSRSVQLWTAAMFGFGTIHWWVATTGGVWTFSHTVSATLLFVAILLTLYKSRPFLYGSRPGGILLDTPSDYSFSPVFCRNVLRRMVQAGRGPEFIQESKPETAYMARGRDRDFHTVECRL